MTQDAKILLATMVSYFLIGIFCGKLWYKKFNKQGVTGLEFAIITLWPCFLIQTSYERYMEWIE